MTIAKRVIYQGRVQGVGFRYMACQIAEEFEVEGYVRNLLGGDVELVLEGETEVVEEFLNGLARRMAGYLSDASMSETPVVAYKEFQIRY